MREKKKTKELEFQRDYDDLQRAANLLDTKEEEYKRKFIILEQEKLELQRQVRKAINFYTVSYQIAGRYSFDLFSVSFICSNLEL